MATFAELQCLNKLLLQKMERMKKETKEKYDELELEYDSLREETIMNGGYVEMSYIRYCKGCNRWFNSEHEGDTSQLCDDSCFKCDTCKHDEDTGLYDCFKCEITICRACKNFKMLECCKYCYLCEQYPLAGERILDLEGWEKKTEVAMLCAEKARKRKRVS